jgi:protein gp37
MGDLTGISWTDATWNPWMGCTKISPGCQHCYAETLTTNRMGLKVWGPRGTRQVTSADNWRKPIRWNREAEQSGKRRKVFCASLCDVFEDHPIANEHRPRIWELIRATPWLDWQLLTKRADRIAANLPPDWGPAGWANTWLGTSIENNDYVCRADHLRTIPATVRFISYEPALGPIDKLDLTGLDWVIAGGESGPGFRPMDLAWGRDIRARCKAAGVAFWFKQSAGIRSGMGDTIDGEKIQNFPTPRLAAPGPNIIAGELFSPSSATG